MACREMLRRLLWRLDLLEPGAKGAELLITERKVGGAEVEHHGRIRCPYAHLGPPRDEAVRLIALPLQRGLKKAGVIRHQVTVVAMRSGSFCS